MVDGGAIVHARRDEVVGMEELTADMHVAVPAEREPLVGVELVLPASAGVGVGAGEGGGAAAAVGLLQDHVDDAGDGVRTVLRGGPSRSTSMWSIAAAGIMLMSTGVAPCCGPASAKMLEVS